MIKVAQVGCGYWGRNLVRNFAAIGALGAVVDSHEETAERYGHDYDVPAMSWDAVLADASIDAVALATTAPTHAPLALQAIAAGKHVYVEKPLALDPEDGRAMIEAARSAGVRLMVGHLLQYHPIFLALADLVREGLIGPLKYVYSNRMSMGKFRVEENVLWSFAPHDLSMILALAGEAPDHVTAQGAVCVTPGIADWATCQLSFPSGLRGHVQASWLHPFKEQRLVVIGEKGSLVFEDSIGDWERKLAHYPFAIEQTGAVPVPHAGQMNYIPVPKGEPLRNECQHFVDAVVSGASPRTDGAEGLRVLEALRLAEAELQRSLL